MTVGEGRPVPLAVAVARWLLDGRAATVITAEADLHDFDAVLVMGDGSNSRDEKSPGHLNPEAIPFDNDMVAALQDGNAEVLADLDLRLAADVGAAAGPVWAAVGRAVATVQSCELDVADAPYGVLYAVARWSVGWADPA